MPMRPASYSFTFLFKFGAAGMIICILITASCSHSAKLRADQKHIIGYPHNSSPSTEVIDAIAVENQMRFQLYADELAWRGRTPRKCLALSGGGIRSSLYAIGVMRALSEYGLLDTLDIISSSSGGGYTLGYYYSGLYREVFNSKENSEKSSVELFTKESLTHLEDAIILEYGPSEKTAPVFEAFDFIRMVVFVPLDALNQLIFLPFSTGEQPALSMLAQSYMSRLNRAFMGAKEYWTEKSPKLADIASMVKTYHFPMFIINATIQGANNADVPIANTIFEYTPFHMGSDGTGYIPLRPEITLGEAVAVSGAATDLPIANATLRLMRDYSGITLGRPIKTGKADGGYYKLTDAGHSENLAAFSLIRRRCNHIIIADAEEDSSYTFEGFQRLKTMVEQSMQAQFYMPEIDDFLTEQHSNSQHARKPKRVPDYAMAGKIGALPIVGYEHTPQVIYIYYLKLSFDPAYYELKYPALLNDKGFPHYPTWNQYGIPAAGRAAIVHLGYGHMRELIQSDLRLKAKGYNAPLISK